MGALEAQVICLHCVKIWSAFVHNPQNSLKSFVYLCEKKLAYLTKYLRMYCTGLHTKFSGLIDMWVGIIYQTFILR